MGLLLLRPTLRHHSGGPASRPILLVQPIIRKRPQGGRRLSRPVLMLMCKETLLTDEMLHMKDLSALVERRAVQLVAVPTKPQRMHKQRIRIPMQEVRRQHGRDLDVLHVSLEQSTTVESAVIHILSISYSCRTKVNMGARRVCTSQCKASMTSMP